MKNKCTMMLCAAAVFGVVAPLFCSELVDGEQFRGSISAEAIGQWDDLQRLWDGIDQKEMYTMLSSQPAGRRIERAIDRGEDPNPVDTVEIGTYLVMRSPIACWSDQKKILVSSFMGALLAFKGEPLPKEVVISVFKTCAAMCRGAAQDSCPVCLEKSDACVASRGRPCMVLPLPTCGHGVCDFCQEELARRSTGDFIQCPVCRTSNKCLVKARQAALAKRSTSACAAGDFLDAIFDGMSAEAAAPQSVIPQDYTAFNAWFQTYCEDCLISDVNRSTSLVVFLSKQSLPMAVAAARNGYAGSAAQLAGVSLEDVEAKTRRNGLVGIGGQQLLEASGYRLSTLVANKASAPVQIGTPEGRHIEIVVTPRLDKIVFAPRDECSCAGGKVPGFAHCPACLKDLWID